MMERAFRCRPLRLSRHVGRAASSDDSNHLIAPQIFCALSRYGVIRFDRPSTLGQNHNPA